jgi:hypothetical protein
MHASLPGRFYGSALTGTGVDRLTLDPLPSPPTLALPQQAAVPSERAAQLVLLVTTTEVAVVSVDTATGTSELVVVPLPS